MDKEACIHILEGHTKDIIHLKVAGDTAMSAAQDQTVRMWNIIDGQCLKVSRVMRVRFIIQVHHLQCSIGSTEIGYNGDCFAVGTTNDEVIIFDAHTGMELHCLSMM